MGMKGNLLYNGDFETGTTEGWKCGVFGKVCQCDFFASSEAKYKGNYGGLILAREEFADAFIAYDKICAFEEYEAYLYIFYVKMVQGYYTCGELWGLDDKGNLIDNFEMGLNMEVGEWRKCICLLRGYRDITHFKVGLWYWGENTGDKCYIDEAKLIPLKSVRSHEIKEYRYFNNVTSSMEWYSVIASVGKTKLRSVLQVSDVSGTSPTIDTEIKCYLFDGTNIPLILEHSQFTNDGVEQATIDLPEVSFIRIKYRISGTNPSFNIYHNLILEPY